MWQIYKRDVKRISKNIFAIIVVIGITILPALYAWFNIGANFDPYSNTKNIKVAVANIDKGTDSGITGELNAGEDIVTNLKKNDQLGWVFTDEEAAIDGVKSGLYYAAIIIPDDFSAKLTNFLTGTAEKSQIVYYVNEKKNAIAPKITDSAAEALETNIKEIFFETASESVAKTVSASLEKVSGKLDAADTDIVEVLKNAATEMDDYKKQLDGFKDVLAEGRSAIDDGNATLEELEGMIEKGQESLDNSQALLAQGREDIGTFSTNMLNILSSGESVLAQINSNTATQMSDLEAQAGEINSNIAGGITSIQDAMQINQQVLDDLGNISSVASSQDLENLIQELQAEITNQQSILDELGSSNDSIGDIVDQSSKARQAVEQNVQDGSTDFQNTIESFNSDLMPQLNQAMDQFATVAGETSGMISTLPQTIDQLQEILKQLESGFSNSEKALKDTETIMLSFTEQIEQILTDLNVVKGSKLYKEILSVTGVSPEQVAGFMKSPVNIKSEVLYPVANYGSALAPFYTNLAIWVGGIILIAIFKMEVVEDKKSGKLNAKKAYWGRWLLFITVGLLQGLVICLGNLYILKIQCDNPLVFIGIGMFISLVYVTLIYSITAAFKHIGKAICVILVILQIPGSAGTYPIEMTPEFFKAIHPLLPFTYGVEAMREAVAGIYMKHLIVDIGHLLVFLGLAFAIGLIVRPRLLNLNHFFDKKLQETDMMLCETEGGVKGTGDKVEDIVAIIAKKQRSSTQREEYKKVIGKEYQKRVKVGFILMFTLPVIFMIMMFSLDSKVYFLVLWIASIIVIATYLIWLEYFKHKAEKYHLIEEEISGMGDSEIIKFLKQKRGGGEQ